MAPVTPGGEEKEGAERMGRSGARRGEALFANADSASPNRRGGGGGGAAAAAAAGAGAGGGGGERLIKDRKRQVDSLSRGSEQASTQRWKRRPLPSNTAPPRSEVYPCSPGLC